MTKRGATVKLPKKHDFPVSNVRRYLEPGPIVLVSSACRGKANIMTLGWHTVLEFSPSLVGLMISAGNHSHDMIKRSGECVINLPTTALIDTVVGIGNTSGDEIDKFASRFGVTIGRDLSDPKNITHNLRTVIIDPEGKLKKTYTGNEWTPDQILADLR